MQYTTNNQYKQHSNIHIENNRTSVYSTVLSVHLIIWWAIRIWIWSYTDLCGFSFMITGSSSACFVPKTYCI